MPYSQFEPIVHSQIAYSAVPRSLEAKRRDSLLAAALSRSEGQREGSEAESWPLSCFVSWTAMCSAGCTQPEGRKARPEEKGKVFSWWKTSTTLTVDSHIAHPAMQSSKVELPLLFSHRLTRPRAAKIALNTSKITPRGKLHQEYFLIIE